MILTLGTGELEKEALASFETSHNSMCTALCSTQLVSRRKNLLKGFPNTHFLIIYACHFAVCVYECVCVNFLIVISILTNTGFPFYFLLFSQASMFVVKLTSFAITRHHQHCHRRRRHCQHQ